MTVDETTRAVAPVRAAEELELKRDEFRLAVRMGLIRTVPNPVAVPDPRGAHRDRPPERRPVARAELDRLKAAPDFPDGLRERVRAVGAGEAAALLSIAYDRFNRLARTGHLSPVRFYLNRYRAVVWLYLAAEVTEFGEKNPGLLTGRLPADVRERDAAGEDLRARNWRSRHLSLLLRDTDDPWARAAAIASLLDPLQVAEVVDDPYERTYLDRLRPVPPPGVPVSGAAHETAARLVRADDPDEILWHRMSLALALDEARTARQAPHPGERRRPAPEQDSTPQPEHPPAAEATEREEPAREAEPAVAPPTPRPLPPPGRPRTDRAAPPPGRATATRRPGLLRRIRRALPGRTTTGGGWGEGHDWR
ncbi:hypothetical protein HHL19_23575 [Streptomyces sp. R302]|uniref:DUF6397 family protein n=1 Tax=unclassified Streptomyces TaxID=2593676 RepID=UPI00145F9524|nr:MULTISPECIES: DUF6397 family protein [unclassified Streptomyces]NML51929.1 hypothetical protein [Streptomyces sp. R301]NML81549.1 hypothetical protein [Streptomyces sp. R302]